MAERPNFRTIWRSAGVPGVVLAAVSIAYMLANFYITKAAFTGHTVVIFILDLAKITACIWLMYRFMAQFKNDNPVSSRGDVRRLGKWISILSALIFSAAMMAFFKIHTEVIAETMDKLLQMYGDSMDTNAINALDRMEENYPQVLFVTNFIYCSIFGWVVSAILSLRIVPSNPFFDEKDGSAHDDTVDEQ